MVFVCSIMAVKDKPLPGNNILHSHKGGTVGTGDGPLPHGVSVNPEGSKFSVLVTVVAMLAGFKLVLGCCAL